jgi:hypothetical protein
LAVPAELQGRDDKLQTLLGGYVDLRLEDMLVRPRDARAAEERFEGYGEPASPSLQGAPEPSTSPAPLDAFNTPLAKASGRSDDKATPSQAGSPYIFGGIGATPTELGLASDSDSDAYDEDLRELFSKDTDARNKPRAHSSLDLTAQVLASDYKPSRKITWASDMWDATVAGATVEASQTPRRPAGAEVDLDRSFASRHGTPQAPSIAGAADSGHHFGLRDSTIDFSHYLTRTGEQALDNMLDESFACRERGLPGTVLLDSSNKGWYTQYVTSS